MKEQWKKHDSDAKLLQNVEEGRPQPIKIELPISAFGLNKQDGCCNRLITILRVAVLFVLLIILSWTAVNLYSNYYPRQLVIDEKAEQQISNQHDFSSEENKSSFRNKVYTMWDKQGDMFNDITSTSAPVSGDNGLDDEGVRFLSEILKIKNIGNVRVVDLALNQENKINDEKENTENVSLETKLHDYVYEKRFNLENVPEPTSANEEDVSVIEPNPMNTVILINQPQEIHDADFFLRRLNVDFEPKTVISSADQQAHEEFYNSSDSELDSKKEDSKEVLKNRYESAEEKENTEVVVIPSVETESPNESDQDSENYMEVLEVDDLEALVNDIANAMGLLQEPSSEVDQSNEESVAIIQEEIKSNEHKLEIDDLDKVGSTEEKSREESVPVVQEDYKTVENGEPVYLIDLKTSSEEEDPNTEDVAVIQEEIKNDSHKFFKPEIIATPIQFAGGMPDHKVSVEDSSREDTSLNNDLNKISQETSSIEDKSRESSETVNIPQRPTNPITPEGIATICAKLLEPFVGQDYNLVHWYYNSFTDPAFVESNDKKKVYAAKVLYNQNITEYDTDVDMWLNEVSVDSYISDFTDLMDPQKQVLPDSFLQSQIVDKLLSKLILKKKYEFNMITFNEAWEMIDLSNSNHIKSWFLATHPSVYEQIPHLSTSMNLRRALYPLMKNDVNAVKKELYEEDADLKLLEFVYSSDDFNEEPIPSILEQHLILNRKLFNKLSNQEKVEETTENLSEETKLTSGYSSDNENESTDISQYQSLINAMKEVGKEYDYSKETILNHHRIIEAMKNVGEEYEQAEKSEEETATTVFKHSDETEDSVVKVVDSIIKNDDDDDNSFNKEVSSSADQFESSNAKVNPNTEIEMSSSEQTFEAPSEESKEIDEIAAFLQRQQAANEEPEENDENEYDSLVPLFDPFDY